MARPPRASEQEIAAFLAAAPGWQYEESALVRSVTAGSFLDGIRWVAEVADVAERMDHHPDIDIRWRTVAFRLSTHDAGGVTALDVALAHAIDGIVASP